MVAMMFTFACDKEGDGSTGNDTVNVQAAKTSGIVPRADAMAIIYSVGAGEMMYKFSYLEPEVDKGGREHLNYANDIFSDTWDRRLFFSVGDDLNGKLCIYDIITDSYEKISLHYEDEEKYASDSRYGL